MNPENSIDRQAPLFPVQVPDAKSARTLARSFYRELRDGGFDHNQILAASNELLDLVTQELRARATTGRADG